MSIYSVTVPEAGVYIEDSTEESEPLTCNTKKDGTRLNERTAGMHILSINVSGVSYL